MSHSMQFMWFSAHAHVINPRKFIFGDLLWQKTAITMVWWSLRRDRSPTDVSCKGAIIVFVSGKFIANHEKSWVLHYDFFKIIIEFRFRVIPFEVVQYRPQDSRLPSWPILCDAVFMLFVFRFSVDAWDIYRLIFVEVAFFCTTYLVTTYDEMMRHISCSALYPISV